MWCKPDGHKLVAVWRTPEGPDIENVVRWCSECGAIVIDTDYDGRIKPGDILPMRLPEISLQAVLKKDKEE